MNTYCGNHVRSSAYFIPVVRMLQGSYHPPSTQLFVTFLSEDNTTTCIDH